MKSWSMTMLAVAHAVLGPTPARVGRRGRWPRALSSLRLALHRPLSRLVSSRLVAAPSLWDAVSAVASR